MIERHSLGWSAKCNKGGGTCHGKTVSRALSLVTNSSALVGHSWLAEAIKMPNVPCIIYVAPTLYTCDSPKVV